MVNKQIASFISIMKEMQGTPSGMMFMTLLKIFPVILWKRNDVEI